MNFTPAQITAVKAAVSADPAMPADPRAGNGPNIVADLFNVVDTDSYFWRTNTDANDISNAIVWANLTPADAADNTAVYTNRALACQAKQLNLQILLQGRYDVNSNKPNIRDGLLSALSNVPSGVEGALVSAGYEAVKVAMTRHGTRFEKLLADATGTASVPANLIYDGMVSAQEIADILETP